MWLSRLRTRLVSIKMQVQSLASLSGSIATCCGVGHRCGSYLTLLWLWHRPAAMAPIGPPSWELPCATGAAQKRQKKKKKKFTECLVCAKLCSRSWSVSSKSAPEYSLMDLAVGTDGKPKQTKQITPANTYGALLCAKRLVVFTTSPIFITILQMKK